MRTTPRFSDAQVVAAAEAQLAWLAALKEVWQVDALWARPDDWDSLIKLLKRE